MERRFLRPLERICFNPETEKSEEAEGNCQKKKLALFYPSRQIIVSFLGHELQTCSTGRHMLRGRLSRQIIVLRVQSSYSLALCSASCVRSASFCCRELNLRFPQRSSPALNNVIGLCVMAVETTPLFSAVPFECSLLTAFSPSVAVAEVPNNREKNLTTARTPLYHKDSFNVAKLRYSVIC